LTNDSDIDNSLSVISFEVEGQTYQAGSSVTVEGGILIINEDGSYSFTPDENWNGVVPVITYTTNTGLTATLSIEVTPIDDPADITVDLASGDSDSGMVTEDGATDADGNTVEAVSGTLSISDVDDGQAAFQVQTDVADGNYGSFSIDADGNWDYVLNNDHIVVQSLTEGETLTRTITVTSADGTATHNITITIVGANDPADITVNLANGDSDSATVTEDGASDVDGNT
ncbi:hypothetical protein G3R48_17120, partial [Shewanella intestini]